MVTAPGASHSEPGPEPTERRVGDGLMGRSTVRKVGIGLTTVGLLLLGVAMAPSAAANQSDGYYLTLASAVFADGNTTYVWSLHHDTRTDAASHLVIDTCLGGTA